MLSRTCRAALMTPLAALLLAGALLPAPALAQGLGTTGTTTSTTTPGLPAGLDPNAPPTPPPADTPERRKERVVFLLSGYEFFPTRADLDRIGTPAQIIGLLDALLSDASTREVLKLRAVEALGLYPDAAAQAPLTRIVRAETRRLKPEDRRFATALRHRAISALARSARGDSTATLAPLLHHSDLQLRLSAIVALGKFARPKADAALTARLKKATEPVELKMLRRFVK